MNFIFKIVEYIEETDQIIVKFCRQNSPVPIDDYPPVAINCYNIDMNDYHQFVSSIMRSGVHVIMQQESEETTLPQNAESEVLESVDIKTQLNRVISLHSNELIATIYKMNKIKLD
jgi:hypothetical protein